jgi:hypothetical protein
MTTYSPAVPVREPPSRRRFPYIVVRLMGSVFQREDIDIQVGEPVAHVGFRNSFVRHPLPYLDDGEISPACRALLVAAVIATVRRTGFRMCLVWRKDACTYCEKDGTADESDDPPSGGFGSGGVGGMESPFDVQFEQRLPMEKGEKS